MEIILYRTVLYRTVSLSGNKPLVGGVIFQMYYGLIELKLFIILNKYISSERSESQDSIYGIYFVIGVSRGIFGTVKG